MLLVANVLLTNFRKLGPKCNVAIENCVSYCAKAIGEETYFVGDKQELVTIILFHCFLRAIGFELVEQQKNAVKIFKNQIK